MFVNNIHVINQSLSFCGELGESDFRTSVTDWQLSKYTASVAPNVHGETEELWAWIDHVTTTQMGWTMAITR